MQRAPLTPPRFHEGLPERLADEQLSDTAASALLNLDVAMFLWHRMAAKGEMPRKLLAELNLDLDLTDLHCLTAITRIETGIGRPAAPATIGAVAEEMNLDPSRASRITADLIQRGYLRREAVQADGRKSVLVLTAAADQVFARFRDRKWDHLIALFRDWPQDDIIRFSALFERYSTAMRDIYTSEA